MKKIIPILFLVLNAAGGVWAQGTAFSYQGRLNDGTNPATGRYDLRFALYDAVTTGAQQGGAVTNASTGVTNGLFTVMLDFGNQFSGAGRWLEIAVRTNGAGVFTTLSPRQPLTATPYSVTAGNVTGPVAAGNISGTIPVTQLPSSLVTNGASGVNFSGTFTGNGAGVTNLNISLNSDHTIVLQTNRFYVSLNPTNFVLANGVAVADFNGDGHPDLSWSESFASDVQVDRIQVFTNNGTGQFSLSSSVTSGPAIFGNLAPDVNGDGWPDLVAVNYDLNLLVFTNNRSGDFGQRVSLNCPTAGTAAATADFNGDGRADLVSGNNDATISVFLNSVSGAFSTNTFSVTNVPFFLAATDINNDNRPDIIAANRSANSITVLTNRGNGTFAWFADYTVGSNPVFVAVADLNADGRPDLAVANRSSASLSILTNSGNGFVPASTPAPGVKPSWLAVADEDDDGKPDLISANFGSTNLVILKNLGGGNFTLLTNFSTFPDRPLVLTAFDVNHDTTSDLISLNLGTMTEILFVRNVRYVFTGDGAGLTNLSFNALSSGTVPDANLSSNVVLLNRASQAFTGDLSVGGILSGNGSGLTNLDAGNISSGTLADARLSDNVSLLNASQTFLAPNTFIDPNNYFNGTFTGSFTGAVSASQFTGTITSSNIANEAVTVNMLAKTWGSYRVLTVTNPVPGIDSYFGQSMVPLGTDRVVIGSYGAVYMLMMDGSLQLSFTNPVPATNINYDPIYGSPVAVFGNDRVIIGSKAGGTNGCGTAYLFSTNGTLLTTFTNPTPANSDAFGSSFAPVGNDRILIGAADDDTGATNAGTVYLFNTNGALLLTITNPTPFRNDFFGEYLVAAGDRLFIGNPLDDTTITNVGTVFVFNTNGVLLNTFTNPMPHKFSGFGYSLTLLGNDRIFIGSGDGLYLFNTNGTLLTAFTNLPFNGFSPSLALLDDNRLLVGSPGDNTGATNAGVVYLFNTNATLLLTITNPVPVTNDNFGSVVTAVGGKALFYANGPYSDPNYDGLVHLYGFYYYIPGLLADTLRPGAVGTDALADGAVTAAKISGVLLPGQIPNIDASKITSGTLADARLSSNVALHNGNQTFFGINTFSSSLNSFTGSGNGLTGLNAGNLIGSVPLAALPAGFITNNTTNVTLSGTFNNNNGGSLTNLNAANIAGGTLADARLSANVALRAGGNSFSGTQVFTNGNVGIGTNNPAFNLHVNGSIAATSLRAPGAGTNTSTFVFTHVAVTTNTSGYITTIYNPLTDNDPGAILIVTHNWTADTNSVTKYDPDVVGVFYSNPHWAIFHENTTSPMLGRAFNVLVIKP